MTYKDELIAGIRAQRERLAELIYQLNSTNELHLTDCKIYEVRTKEVEKNLKRLRHLAAKELMSEISIQPKHVLGEEFSNEN